MKIKIIYFKIELKKRQKMQNRKKKKGWNKYHCTTITTYFI